jgi:hypothetical protein
MVPEVCGALGHVEVAPPIIEHSNQLMFSITKEDVKYKWRELVNLLLNARDVKSRGPAGLDTRWPETSHGTITTITCI